MAGLLAALAVALAAYRDRQAAPSGARSEVLPATHFMRIVRGLMLKGAAFGSISAELLALVAILLVVSTLAISRYKVTLD